MWAESIFITICRDYSIVTNTRSVITTCLYCDLLNLGVASDVICASTLAHYVQSYPADARHCAGSRSDAGPTSQTSAQHRGSCRLAPAVCSLCMFCCFPWTTLAGSLPLLSVAPTASWLWTFLKHTLRRRLWKISVDWCLQSIPSKHKTFLLHLYNVDQRRRGLGRRCTNVIKMFRVCWVCKFKVVVRVHSCASKISYFQRSSLYICIYIKVLNW